MPPHTKAARMSELQSFHSDLITAVSTQDIPRIRSLIDPDFVIYYDSSLPFGGAYRGVNGFFAVLSELMLTLHDVETQHLNYMEDANGEQYSVIIRLTARMPDIDRQVETHVSELWTVRNGKAVEARVWYWGAAALLTAQGVGVSTFGTGKSGTSAHEYPHRCPDQSSSSERVDPGGSHPSDAQTSPHWRAGYR
jgi:ketosteroid isomerase-like protein